MVPNETAEESQICSSGCGGGLIAASVKSTHTKYTLNSPHIYAADRTQCRTLEERIGRFRLGKEDIAMGIFFWRYASK